jgi:hypothetical protein
MNAASAPQVQSAAVSRPRVVDYFLLLCGCFLSVMLGEMSGLKAGTSTSAPPMLLEYLLRIFPQLLFLPIGIVLLWPLFCTTQRIVGRKQGLTIGEWLWGLTWLVTLFLSGWITCKALGMLPEFLAGQSFQRGMVVGYVIFAISAAAIAVIVFLVDLVGRWPQPWTHQLALVLMIWPAVPLAAVWLWNIKLE